MPTIKLKDGTTLRVTQEQQAKLAMLFMSKPNLKTEINKITFTIKDIVSLDAESLHDKFKAQQLNMDWYTKKLSPKARTRGDSSPNHNIS